MGLHFKPTSQETAINEASSVGPKKLRIWVIVLLGLLSFVLVLLGRTMWWGEHTWGDLSMEEIIYTLTSPLEGTGGGMVDKYVIECVPFSLIAVGSVLAVLLVLRSKGRGAGYVALAGVLAACVYFGTNLHSAWNSFEMTDYLKGQTTESTFIDDNYVSPSITTVSFPKNKRNLIYIFLESMEAEFVSKEEGGLLEHNVIPELAQLALDNQSFSGGDGINGGFSPAGTRWTMGGLFAQSSGLPLMIGSEGLAMETQNSFFPIVTTLGDILEDNGYRNVFLCGSNALFGGRKLFFQSHGNFEIHDYGYALSKGRIPEGYHVFWGYEDAKLFEFAKADALELAESGEPFNLTILTVDTHFEDGYLEADAKTPFGDDQYANVIADSSRRVAEFVEWAQSQEFYENTTIVLVGDHPTMDSNFIDAKEHPAASRRVYTCIINSPMDPVEDASRTFTTLDMFPTTLAALGVSIEGDRLALGTNLYSSTPTWAETLTVDGLSTELRSKSKLLGRLESIDEDLKSKAVVEKTPDGETYKVTFLNPPGADDIVSMRFAVWQEKTQSDIVWTDAERQSDGSYVGYFQTKDFEGKAPEHYFSASITFADGTSGGSANLTVMLD